MKAQFATIEAGIALVLVVSAIGFVSSIVNSSTASLEAQSAGLQSRIALYDVINALEHNATYAWGNLSGLFGVGTISVSAQRARNGTCASALVGNETLYACVSGCVHVLLRACDAGGRALPCSVPSGSDGRGELALMDSRCLRRRSAQHRLGRGHTD